MCNIWHTSGKNHYGAAKPRKPLKKDSQLQDRRYPHPWVPLNWVRTTNLPNYLHHDHLQPTTSFTNPSLDFFNKHQSNILALSSSSKQGNMPKAKTPNMRKDNFKLYHFPSWKSIQSRPSVSGEKENSKKRELTK